MRQAVTAKICCNKDAPRFPRWLTSTRAAEHAWLPKCWGRKAEAETGREEGIFAEQTCSRARSVLRTITAQVQSLYWCYTA